MTAQQRRKDVTKFEKNVIKLKNCRIKNMFLSEFFTTRVHLISLKQVQKMYSRYRKSTTYFVY